MLTNNNITGSIKEHATLSVVVPVYKAENCLDEPYQRLKAALETILQDLDTSIFLSQMQDAYGASDIETHTNSLAVRMANEVLSLPMGPHLTDEDVDMIIQVVSCC